MTSPSCQEPGRSCLTKDTVAVAPGNHLPKLLPAHMRVVVEASFPEHSEMQMTPGVGVCCPVVDQEPNWEESRATAKTDSRRKSSRTVRPGCLVLENITVCNPSPKKRREDQGLHQRVTGSRQKGAQKVWGEPLPARAPPTHAGNNQKGWLALSWLSPPASGTGERQASSAHGKLAAMPT